METNLSHIQQEVSLLCWIRTRKTDPEAAAGQEAKAVVRGRHASRGSWARQSGHRRLQAELTRPGPRILAPGSGTRLRLLPAKLPARLGGPRVPHARGSPPPARSGVPILQGGLCAPRVGRRVLILSSGQSGADCGVLAAAPHSLPLFGFSPILTVRPRASQSPVLDQCYGVCEILANGQDLNAMASRGHRPTETMFSRRDGPQT